MRVFGKINIIGLDNGYGNIKTANGIFPASVTCCETEPAHAQDMLVYDGKYYVIGAGHREFTLDKVGNQDHYLLTLAGIGQELWCNQLTTAAVHLAVGLPLTWVGDQREQFRAYLSQNRHVDFNWRASTTMLIWSAWTCTRRGIPPSFPNCGNSPGRICCAILETAP